MGVWYKEKILMIQASSIEQESQQTHLEPLAMVHNILHLNAIPF
jgi:hypothetical protein